MGHLHLFELFCTYFEQEGLTPMLYYIIDKQTNQTRSDINENSRL